ncbi:extracellular solute-binding protein [Mesorhizobium sp. B3-1-9]|uniref:extracellular solute-binding protein n=1 Tax=Mesorhizobium sp. B3-1-9 TaxID=2589892 RepID=UPI001FEE675C|nr:extracellular solute-binding protein [Mesorhizobium sp. B3-1-9]
MGAAAGAMAALYGVRAEAQELTIFWAEWDPASYLQELVSEYTAQTGVKVTVETTPWADFMTKTFVELNGHGDAFDLVVGDSQWLGTATAGGHYVDLTSFVQDNNLNQIMLPATMTHYSEYPQGSGRYWSVPLEADAVGWAYRKDWFEDPAEKEAFAARYGYQLAPPKTWSEMRDIAEFFYRPDDGRYGIAIYAYTGIETLVMGYENALFSFGGDLADYATCQVQGFVNSKQAVEALKAYRELYTFGPPHWGGNGFQEKENNRAITEGLTAMSMNFFAFFPTLLNPAVNPHAADTGFFANPAGPRGERFSALGGQGISIVSYSQKRDESMRFLEWLIREDTQRRWAQLGGYPAHAEVLASPAFLNDTPYNRAFFESMAVVKDFWTERYYGELLIQMNNRLGPYVVGGQGDAAEVLNALASDWEATVAKYGCH